MDNFEHWYNKQGIFIIGSSNAPKWHSHFEKKNWQFLTKLNIQLFYSAEILASIYLRNKNKSTKGLYSTACDSLIHNPNNHQRLSTQVNKAWHAKAGPTTESRQHHGSEDV